MDTIKTAVTTSYMLKRYKPYFKTYEKLLKEKIYVRIERSEINPHL